MADKYKGQGQYQLNKLSLIVSDQSTGQDQEIDLRAVFVDVTIYESMWSVLMSGAVSIIDSYNMPDVLPLYGDEKLEVEFFTSGNEKNPISFTGHVYKIDPPNRISEHSKGYNIHFVSPAGLASERSHVQRGFKTTADAIVKAIHSDHFANASNKRCETSSTIGVHPYTFGSVSPLDAISIVSRDAQSTEGNNAFLFFENNQTFVWKPLQELYQQDPVTAFYYRNTGVYKDIKQKNVESFNAIQDFEVLEEASFLDRVRDGQHGSQHLYLDLFAKKMVTKTFDRDQQFDPTKSLGDQASKKPLTNPKYTDRWFIEYVASDIDVRSKGYLSMMGRMVADTFNARIVTYGDSSLAAGQTCSVQLPNWNQDQENVKSSATGKFLMSEIKHTLSNKDYYQTIMIQKDAFANKEKVPDS